MGSILAHWRPWGAVRARRPLGRAAGALEACGLGAEDWGLQMGACGLGVEDWVLQTGACGRGLWTGAGSRHQRARLGWQCGQEWRQHLTAPYPTCCVTTSW